MNIRLDKTMKGLVLRVFIIEALVCPYPGFFRHANVEYFSKPAEYNYALSVLIFIRLQFGFNLTFMFNPSSMQKFKIGEAARLKLGGPNMAWGITPGFFYFKNQGMGTPYMG